MAKVRWFLKIGTTAVIAMAAVSILAMAQAPVIQTKAIFARPIIWSSVSTGGYAFTGAALANTALAKDGSVVSGASQGVCELSGYYKTNGLITGLSANWSFIGKVTMEVSITGSSKDYLPVVNGVPRSYKESEYGDRIKWRATLAPGSSLTGIRIVYSDLSGMAGSFGSELLSGFSSRKRVYIKGSSSGSLFNYQVPVRVGESQKSASPCDLKLNGGILSGFADIRFTLPDGETVLPHYLESVTGQAPNRTAFFWVRIPEIPRDGIPMYMYYGKAIAPDLSSPDKVFDFFDDFTEPDLNPKRWKVIIYDASGVAGSSDSLLSLKKAAITSADYLFADGVIEYKARASANGAAALIIRSTSASGGDLIAYSSVSSPESSHSIARGTTTEANDPKPISAGILYTYKIYCDDKGSVTFRRYGEDGSGVAQAETVYSAGPKGAYPIGLLSSIPGETMDCLWIRTRKAANPPPQVDLDKTASAVSEQVDTPEFYNLTTAPDGSLAPIDRTLESYYISRLISSAFEARILKPSWETDPSGKAIPVSIAVKKGGKFYTGWVSGTAHYASKKEFEKGSQLRWKAVISSPGESMSKEAISLRSFTLEYWPGDIRIVMPKDGDTLAPGARYTIFWEAPGYGPKYPMEVSYSVAGSEDFKIIAPNVENSGDYAWYVPKKASGKAVVKVSDYNDKEIYGISEGYFSIVPGAFVGQGTEAAKSAEEAALKEERKALSAPEEKSLEGYYDLLIKVGDNPLPDGYKDGDIVMVKPAGYLWSAGEKGKFLIVRARLTPERALELMKPGENITIIDKSGRKSAKASKRRSYRFDLRGKITLQERARALRGNLTGKPMEVSDIAEMTEKK